MYPIDVQPFTPSLVWIWDFIGMILVIPLFLLFLAACFAFMIAVAFMFYFLFEPGEAIQWLKDINIFARYKE